MGLNSFIFVGLLVSMDHREKRSAKYDWLYYIYTPSVSCHYGVYAI